MSVAALPAPPALPAPSAAREPIVLRSGRGALNVLALSAAETNANAPGGGGAKNSQRRFKGIAYTGATVDSWYGPVIIDLAGIDLGALKSGGAEGGTLPAFYNHARGSMFGAPGNPRVGVIDQAALSEGGLEIGGKFLSNETAAAIVADADEGYPWELSIRVDPTEITQLAPGATIEINGRAVTGPLTIASASRLREVSFVELGADPNTETQMLRDRHAAGAAETASMSTPSAPGTAPATPATATAAAPALALAGSPAISPPPAAAPSLPGAATIAELEALPGSDDRFVLGALKRGLTLSAATSELCGLLHERLKAAPAAPAGTGALPAAPGVAPGNLALAASAAGGAAIGGAVQTGESVTIGGHTIRLAAGARGENPRDDWAASAELRTHWKDNQRAYLNFAKAQKDLGEPTHALPLG